MQEKHFSLEEIYPLIEETLTKGGVFRFSPQGVSMLPFLLAGRDEVLLSSVDTPMPLDVCLYRRADGSFVLHRVVKRERDGTYSFVGDNQSYIERGIPREAILARVTKIFRDGEEHSIEEAAFMRYARRHLRRVRFRDLIQRVRGRLSRLYRKIFKR